MPSKTKTIGSGETRSLILEAALREFAEEGYAGARTDHIARAAGVNIALLFYYFKSKDQLYGAVLEKIFADWNMAVLKELEGGKDPGNKIMRFVSGYFDFVATAPARPRLVQQEMMRRGRSGSRHIRTLARKYIKPVHRRVREVIQQGVRSGDFRRLDAEHAAYSITAVINSYFANSPLITILSGRDPLASAAIRRRKREVLRFLQNALFNG
jgi:TetR/AcrR family transcriptional regulator